MTKSSAYGLTLVVSTQWLDGSGYRPVQVSVLPAAPPKADQTLHVEFKAQERSYPPRQILVSQDIEIPAGSTQVTDTLAVPQEFAFQWCEVEVWLDGVHKPKLTQNAPVGVSGLHSEGLPNILIVSGALTLGPPAGPFTIAMVADPDSSVLAGIFPDELVQQQGYGYGRPVATTTPAGTTLVAPSLPTLITVPYNHLPRRWIEFSSLDIVCLSLADLTALRGAEPERWQALRRWAAAGGNLLVFGVGAKLDRIDEISDALQLPRGDDTAGEWTKPNPADFGNRLNSPYSGFGTVVVDAPVAGSPPLASEPPFLLHPFGTGMVVAVAADDLFKEPQQNWAWMLNSLGPDRWLWYRRHGLSRERKNADFWNWLVRGVGLAPVTEFRVLITVFVLAIGPVNYFWLRRRGRLHLLVVIVPLAAMAVTLGLFGYAVLADGLDIRVRARTFTQIDQRSGQAVCWSRLSYYAGLAPAGGLTFPDDVVVSPLTANDSGESDMARRQSLAWSQHEQHLVSGWLASRTPMQFVTVRSRTSQAGLRLLPPRGQAGPQVENQLGTRVVRLLLSDEQGRHFRAVDLAAGARGQLEAASPADEEAAIYEFVKDRQPSVPEGFVAPSAQVFAGRRRFMYAATNNSLLGASLASGLLEANLREAVLGPGKHVSLSKPTGFPLAPRSYLAVVERSPEVVFGVDQVREEDSLHIVVGKW
ncbi:MAG TPA: hypothetical protein VNH11_18995 [Pirellulales bacterium]|nr:hypothetical protein [Pirellulales bacterium]